jgi:hypothetical protein
MCEEKSLYRGSMKHKQRPAAGRKGSLCPDWTHDIGTSKFGNDEFAHNWNQTEAHKLFKVSVDDPEGSGAKFATAQGIAFRAVPTNDGFWHGFPEPWNRVPATLVEQWRDEGKVSRRQIKMYSEVSLDNIRWALDDEG